MAVVVAMDIHTEAVAAEDTTTRTVEEVVDMVTHTDPELWTDTVTTDTHTRIR